MDRYDQAKILAGKLAGIALLGIGWCATAVGANSSVPCDQADTDLQSLEVAVSELAVDRVDHMATAADTPIREVLEGQASAEAAAPVLFLTPRAATILRNVFDSENDAAAAESDSESDAQAPTVQPDSTEKLAPVTLIDRAADTPRFQRQMYRKDI